MSKNGSSAGSGSGAGRKGRTAAKPAREPLETRAAKAEAKATDRLRRAEVDLRKDLHRDGKLNHQLDQAGKDRVARQNRRIERTNRRINQVYDIGSHARQMARKAKQS